MFWSEATAERNAETLDRMLWCAAASCFTTGTERRRRRCFQLPQTAVSKTGPRAEGQPSNHQQTSIITTSSHSCIYLSVHPSLCHPSIWLSNTTSIIIHPKPLHHLSLLHSSSIIHHLIIYSSFHLSIINPSIHYSSIHPSIHRCIHPFRSLWKDLSLTTIRQAKHLITILYYIPLLSTTKLLFFLNIHTHYQPK